MVPQVKIDVSDVERVISLLDECLTSAEGYAQSDAIMSSLEILQDYLDEYNNQYN
jgi:hypothetical protein